MKLIAITAMLVMSVSAFAQSTIENAEELYSNRGTLAQNANTAANIYNGLANATTDKVEKAELLMLSAKARYFYANSLSDKDKKETLHKIGYETALKAVNILKNFSSDEEEEMYALAQYEYGANLGKWAEARGISSSLGKWPDLREAMEKIIDLDTYYDVNAYGANRILGRGYFKVPGLMGGDKKKAKALLEEANEETLHDDYGISIYSTNVLYLADSYKKKSKKKACKMLKALVSVDPAVYNADRIPETKTDIKEAKKKIDKFNCN
jgi:hypothetical protein